MATTDLELVSGHRGPPPPRDGELPPLRFCRRGPALPEVPAAPGIARTGIEPAVRRAATALARRSGTSELAVLLSAFVATIWRSTRQDELRIAVGADGSVTLALTPGLRFDELVSMVWQRLGASVPLRSHRGAGVPEPVAQARFSFVDATSVPGGPTAALGGEPLHGAVVRSVDGTVAELHHAGDVLDDGGADRWLGAYTEVLRDATARPGAPLAELAMLPDHEAARRVAEADARVEHYPDLQPIHVPFEAMARARPGAVAVEAGPSSITYGELDRRADALAAALRASDVQPDHLVGVCMERSIDLVVALLAILKSGAAFVPLDPRSPVERLRLIAQDAGLSVVLTQDPLLGRLSPLPMRLLVERSGSPIPPLPMPPVPASLDRAAFVYYTSGSTATPKGVLIDHRCAAGRLEWLRRRYELVEGDRVVHKTPLIFDVAIWEVFGPLASAATVLLADPGAEADAEHLARLLGTPGTRFVHFVPSMLGAYLESVAPQPYPDLQWVQLSGEAVPAHLLDRFADHFDAELHNLYGQTETSEVAGWEGRSSTGAADVPIGHQLGLYRLLLLDDALRPVPPEVPAELHVAGLGGLARGYLGRPQLTAERFVPHPHPVVPGERLYRTGDLAWADSAGTLHYWGRVDGQTKIRGCRVEPAEVEAVLRRHPTVQDAAVEARPDASGANRLVAYLVGDQPSVHEITRHVEQHLPGYLRPEVYVELGALPRTPSGKLDRRRLPDPSPDDLGAGVTDEAPHTPVEAEVGRCWQEVLGIERVGRTDDFFGIGGNSLRALQVLNRIRATFGVRLKVSEFFAEPTVEALAAGIERGVAELVAGMTEEDAVRLLDELRAGGADALG